MFTTMLFVGLAMAGADTCEKFVDTNETAAVMRTGGAGAQGKQAVMFEVKHTDAGADVTVRMVGNNNDNAMLRPGSSVRFKRADGKTIEMTTTELASPEYLATFVEPVFLVTGKLDRAGVAFLADSTLASVEVPGRLLSMPMDRWKTPERVQMVAGCYLDVAPKPVIEAGPAPEAPVAPAEKPEPADVDEPAATY